MKRRRDLSRPSVERRMLESGMAKERRVRIGLPNMGRNLISVKIRSKTRVMCQHGGVHGIVCACRGGQSGRSQRGRG